MSTIVLENPEVIGRLRLVWIRNGKRLHRNYNWKVTVFRDRIIEMIAAKAPIYGLCIKYVSPKGTTHSREHDVIMKRYGLDRHMASAYLLALRGV